MKPWVASYVGHVWSGSKTWFIDNRTCERCGGNPDDVHPNRVCDRLSMYGIESQRRSPPPKDES